MRCIKSALLASATILVASTTVYAQVPPFAPTEVELEGLIQGFDYENRTITVMGTTVSVPPDAAVTISTPTNGDILWEEVVNANGVSPALPGKPNGFLEGTAIVIGTTNGETVTASHIDLNPEENVALGYITENSGGILKLNGMKIALMPAKAGGAAFPAGSVGFDARTPGNPLKNDFGFPLARNSVKPGTPVAAEGWYDKANQTMVLWDLEVSGGEVAAPLNSKISILRAQCRERAPNDIELELRGATYRGTTSSPVSRVEVFRPGVAGSVRRFTYPINVTSTADAEDGRFALYRVDARLTNAQTGSAAGDGCPTTIAVRILDTAGNPIPGPIGGAQFVQTSAGVDIRID
jgi:hypothetical protein